MPRLTMNSYERDGKSLKYITDHNLAHAKNVIDHGDSFSPSLFIITKDTLFYILLDTNLAELMKASPMDQVEPMVNGFLENTKKMGTVVAYQVIGEAWMKRFTMPEDKKLPPVGHGDIAKMADRIEVLMESCIRKGKIASFKTVASVCRTILSSMYTHHFV